MPWQGVCPMDLRMRLVTAMLAEEDSMTALCEEYGVSRKTGYKWLARYRAAGPAGLAERSRAPQVVPWAITQAQAEAIVGLRRQHPSWGPKKLHARQRAGAGTRVASAEHHRRFIAARGPQPPAPAPPRAGDPDEWRAVPGG